MDDGPDGSSYRSRRTQTNRRLMPNIACLPSKNIVHSAKVASFARRAAEFGLELGSFKIDMAGVQRRKRKMVEDEIQGHLNLYKASGAELIMGSARFIAPRTVEVSLND